MWQHRQHQRRGAGPDPERAAGHRGLGRLREQPGWYLRPPDQGHPFDDGNDSGTNYADAEQACAADFAMVGNASGFDDGAPRP
jgi:hypothetical protein